MKKWTMEQVKAARVNDRELQDCEPWMQEMFKDCAGEQAESLLLFLAIGGRWMAPGSGEHNDGTYRIPENWPPADQIKDVKPTPAEFSTQYMLGGEPYHPEDDATELQRLLDGRADLNDGIKAVRARQRRFRAFVAKKEGVKG